MSRTTWIDLAGRDLALDGVEKADEFLVAVALHAAADDGAVEHVERGEQRGRAVALVVVRHRPAAARLDRQSGLGAVERLDLALLVDRQHHGVRRRIDIEADDVGSLAAKLGIARALEGAQPVRLQAVRPPDALHRARRDADRLGHRPAGPVGRLVRRLGRRSAPPPALDGLRPQRRLAGLAGLVAQQTVDPSSAKRCCQRQTSVFDLPVRRMIATVPRPSAVSSTIRPARHASEGRCGYR